MREPPKVYFYDIQLNVSTEFQMESKSILNVRLWQ
jgi:hypothetical protein